MDTNYTAHLGSGDEMSSCHGDRALTPSPNSEDMKCNFSSAALRKAKDR